MVRVVEKAKHVFFSASLTSMELPIMTPMIMCEFTANCIIRKAPKVGILAWKVEEM